MTELRGRFSVLMLVAVLLGSLGACSDQRPVQVSASSIVPLDTLQDWVTYGDYFVKMTVVSEQRIEPSREQLEAGEGVIGRRIEVRIDSRGWERPTLSKSIQIPEEFSTGGGFWLFKGDKVTETAVDGRAWLGVGESFYALMAYVDPELHTFPDKPASQIEPQWGPLVYLPVKDDQVVKLDANAAEPALQTVSGLNLDEISKRLDETAPDPEAAPFMDEDPALRAEHVASK